MAERTCTVGGCGKALYARGCCTPHYRRLRLYGDPSASRPYGRKPKPRPSCTVDGCGELRHGRGLCKFHWQRWYRDGDPEHERHTPVGYLLERVEVGHPLGCWEWTGTISPDGYGTRGVPGKDRHVRAYRWTFELLRGPIPEGLTLDHLCRNRRCVNPDHLEAVPMRENVLRGYGPSARNARKTHCPRSHPLFGENLYVDPKGRRRCRKCQREQTQASRERRRRRLSGAA